MQLELECQGVKLVATDQSWLENLSASSCGRLVDLRKVSEFESLPEEALKQAKIPRVSIPVTPSTWSEQDMDTLRREFLRGTSPVVVLSKEGKRASLMVLQHVGRVLQWTPEHALEQCPDLGRHPDFKKLLVEYLQRHRRA